MADQAHDVGRVVQSLDRTRERVQPTREQHYVMRLFWRDLEFLTVEEMCAVRSMAGLEIEPVLAIRSVRLTLGVSA